MHAGVDITGCHFLGHQNPLQVELFVVIFREELGLDIFLAEIIFVCCLLEAGFPEADMEEFGMQDDYESTWIGKEAG